MSRLATRAFDRLEEGATLALFAVMSGAVLLQLAFRFLFNNPLMFPEEVSRFCYVWITFLGLSLATKTGEHIRLTLAVDALPGGLRRVVVAGTEILSAVILLGLAVLGIRFMDFSRMSISPALEIPMNFVYAAFPAGCLLAMVRLARGLGTVLRGGR